MRRFLSALLISCGLVAAWPLEAAVTTTTELVSVVAGAPGTFSFSVSGWLGGGIVTGTFAGTDTVADGQLSSFDGEITAFTMSYSGGTIVGAIALGFADLFGLVYDLDGGPLGDGLLLDVEGIGAFSASALFAIGPGPFGVCGGTAICGIIETLDTRVAEPGVLSLLLAGLGLLGARALRRRSR